MTGMAERGRSQTEQRASPETRTSRVLESSVPVSVSTRSLVQGSVLQTPETEKLLSFSPSGAPGSQQNNTGLSSSEAIPVWLPVRCLWRETSQRQRQWPPPALAFIHNTTAVRGGRSYEDRPCVNTGCHVLSWIDSDLAAINEAVNMISNRSFYKLHQTLQLLNSYVLVPTPILIVCSALDEYIFKMTKYQIKTMQSSL